MHRRTKIKIVTIVLTSSLYLLTAVTAAATADQPRHVIISATEFHRVPDTSKSLDQLIGNQMTGINTSSSINLDKPNGLRGLERPLLYISWIKSTKVINSVVSTHEQAVSVSPTTTTTVVVPPVVTTTTTTLPPPQQSPVVATPAPAYQAPPVNNYNASGWQQLRNCESGGNYSINTGNGYYGAYQFSISTWEGVGFSGIPSDASPETQDAAAQKLYSMRGSQPWPVCGRYLG